MASKMAVAKPNIRQFPLFQCFLPEIKVVLTKNIMWDPQKWFEKYWMYRCYGNYNIAIIKFLLCSLCGITLPNRLCPRSEWHIIIFSGFYLYIEEVAVPAKCLSPIMYVTLKLVCENIAMILLCGLATAVIYQLPRLERIALFMLVLSDRNG